MHAELKLAPQDVRCRHDPVTPRESPDAEHCRFPAGTALKQGRSSDGREVVPDTAPGVNSAGTTGTNLDGRLALSVREAADCLGISEKSIRRLIARGLLRPSTALRHLLIPKRVLERFLRDTLAR